MRPLRIAHVVTSLVAGGAQRQAIALAEGLPKDRFRVDFLAIGGPGEYDERARAAGAGVHYLGRRRAPGESWVAGQRRRATMLRQYMQTVRRGRYDIVDAWLYPDDVLAALLRRITGTPIVMSGRRNVQTHQRLGPLSGAVDRLTARLTDVVVANSAAAAGVAVRSHHTDPAKLHIIHNGVELIDPLSPDERGEWRRRWGAADDQIVIGAVGRFHPVKGYPMLIDAFARIAGQAPEPRLVIVGDGLLRGVLEGQVRALGLEDRVHLHGVEFDPRRMFGAFDIVAQASRSESLPNVLLEAAAAGRPVVATNVGGSGEVVVDGQTGLLVPAEDAPALADGLRRLIADPPLRERLGRAARERVADVFGMARFVREYGELYESIATAKGVRP